MSEYAYEPPLCSSNWPTYRLFGLTFVSDFPFANRLSPAVGGSDSDLIFTTVATAPMLATLPECLYSSPKQTADGKSLLTVERSGDCYLLRFARLVEFYLWPKQILSHLLDPAYDYLVEIFLLGKVLAFWLEWQNILALHAAAVSVNGKAIAFLASNKGGKSSLAATFMQAGYPLLTDDILPICEQAGLVMGQPGYPQMRMWPEQAQHFVGSYESLDVVHPELSKRRVPVGANGLGLFCSQPQSLAAFYLPQRRDPANYGTAIEISPLPRINALFELVEQAFAAKIVKTLSNRPQRLAFLSHLVQQVPVRRLFYPAGFEFLPRVREAILADLERLGRLT